MRIVVGLLVASLATALPVRAGDEPAPLPLDLEALPAPKPAPKKKSDKTQPAPWLHKTVDLKAQKPAPKPVPQAPGLAMPEAEPPPPIVIAPPPAQQMAPPAVDPAPLLKLVTQYGLVTVRTPLLDEATRADIESGLRGVVFTSPLAQQPVMLRTDVSTCVEDACFAAAGAKDGVDEVLVAMPSRKDNAIALEVRRIDVAGKSRRGAAQAGGLSNDRAELKASAEALLCKLIVPSGCTGEAIIEAPAGTVLTSDGKTLATSSGGPTRVKLPVGLNHVRAAWNGKAGPERVVAVLREQPSGVALLARTGPDGAPRLVGPNEPAPAAIAAAPASAVAAHGAPVAQKSAAWVRPTSAGLIAGGVAAAVVGAVQGLRSKSMISSAETSYHSNGAYLSTDVSNLRDGASAAKSANLLFIAGGALAAAGLTVAFAF